MALPPFLCRRAPQLRALREDLLRLPPFLAAPRLMPHPVFQPEVIPVVEKDALGARPLRALAPADPPQVIVLIRQALAARVIPVVPERAQIPQAHGIGVTGDGLE